MDVNIRLRNIFYLTTAIFILWFLYSVRDILGPFVVALIFAYVFNPLINFFSKNLKIPRAISIITVYGLLIASAISIVIFSTRALISESKSIVDNVSSFLRTLQENINFLPVWVRPYARQYIDYFSNAQLLGNIKILPFPVFTKAFSGVINFVIFLVSAFFFLKDGGKMIERILLFVPDEYRIDTSVLLKKINFVLSRYLRGLIILVVALMAMLFAGLSIIGAKYALTISIGSALFGIIPMIGMPIASVVGTIIVLSSGGVHNFHLNILQTIIAVLAVYYIANQIQDYVIHPFVIGRVTKLHPFIVLFSVVAGAKIYGILGVLLAVPVAASLKIFYEFMLDKIKEEDRRRAKVTTA